MVPFSLSMMVSVNMSLSVHVCIYAMMSIPLKGSLINTKSSYAMKSYPVKCSLIEAKSLIGIQTKWSPIGMSDHKGCIDRLSLAKKNR